MRKAAFAYCGMNTSMKPQGCKEMEEMKWETRRNKRRQKAPPEKQ